MAESRRQKLIDTALALFYRHGIHATGIDRILEDAGVAKMTLYKHFRSKEALIEAALADRSERFRAWFVQEVERRGRTPRERLLAVFDIHDSWFGSRDFFGCPFVNAAAEFAAADDPVHRRAGRHKAEIRRFMAELCRAAGAVDPEALASSLMILVEGATTVAHVMDHRNAGAEARRAATLLIDHATGGTGAKAA
jgi:AcrR family transcriptional regulator